MTKIECSSRHLPLALAAILVSSASASAADWPQWGGPDRNFAVGGVPLAESWPEDGPPRIWHQKLGVGYSGIVVSDGKLYTMYRDDINVGVEYTVALDAATGATLWRHENPAPLAPPPADPPDARWGGQGPNSTPLLVGGRLYTIGSKALMLCFQKDTGKVLWRRDLAADFGAAMRENDNNTGFCASPLAYKNMVIVPIGRKPSDDAGEDRSLVALDQESGNVVWNSQRFTTGAASPIVVTLDGHDQLVLQVSHEVIGVNPKDGALAWRYPIPEVEWPVVSPVWTEGDLVLVKGREEAHMIRLVRNGDSTQPEALWSSRKIRCAIGTPVPLGQHLYGSTDLLLLGFEAQTGKRLWVKRQFPSASVLAAGDKLIILDQDGRLTLATPTPEDLVVHAQAQVAERYSLTAPVLVDGTLYLRDRKHIMALDLSPQPDKSASAARAESPAFDQTDRSALGSISGSTSPLAQ
jgi:outer membrane protein assembly factor BamB